MPIEFMFLADRVDAIPIILVATNDNDLVGAAQLKYREMAPRYGVETLHLQTEALDGGLYARLGWMPYAQVTSRGLDVLVMEQQLSG